MPHKPTVGSTNSEFPMPMTYAKAEGPTFSKCPKGSRRLEVTAIAKDKEIMQHALTAASRHCAASF